MCRILDNAKTAVSESQIKEASINYKCDNAKYDPQRPSIRHNGPGATGSHAAVDLYYRIEDTGKSVPHLITVCMIIRYTLAKKAKTHRTEDVLRVSSESGRNSLVRLTG